MHEAFAGGTAVRTRGRTIHRARFYDALVQAVMLGRAPQLRARTLELGRIGPGSRVLEIGCGTGELSLAAGPRVGASGAVHGIDASPEMVEVARRKAARAGAAVQFRQGAAEALPFADGAFDVVLSSLMMHHLPEEVKRQAVAEARRVLRPGGRLVVVDARAPSTLGERLLASLVLHGRLSNGLEDLPGLFRAHGFTGVREGAMVGPLLGFVTGRVP